MILTNTAETGTQSQAGPPARDCVPMPEPAAVRDTARRLRAGGAKATARELHVLAGLLDEERLGGA